MEFKINSNDVEETTSDYNHFEQDDFQPTSINDSLFNNPEQSEDKSNVVTHNQYGMRWYLFMVWGVLIYYPISLVLSVINNFSLLDAYRNMMSRYDSSYYTTMFVFMLITIIIECVIFYFTLKARTELLDFKASGVKKLKVSIIVPGIYVVVMFFVYFIFVEKQRLEAIRELFDVLLNPNNFLSHGIWKIHAYIATYIAFVVGNIKYFNNRKNFFVN